MELNKILVVEDDKSIQLLVKAGVRKVENLQLEIVDNGKEALELLSDWIPDLILMDVMMPVLGGLETLEIILKDKQLQNIPVVIMSATSDEVKIKSYIETGAIGFIPKPFAPTKIYEELTNLYAKNI